MGLHRLKPDEMSGPVGQVSVGEHLMMYLQTSISDAVSNVFDPQTDSVTDMNQWLINATKTVNAAIADGSSPAMYKDDFIDSDADDGDGNGNGEDCAPTAGPAAANIATSVSWIVCSADSCSTDSCSADSCSAIRAFS